MGDQTKDPDDGKEPDDKSGNAGDLGEAGRKALDSERKARRDAERRLAEVEAQLRELADKDKPELERLREQVTTLTAERDAAKGSLTRYEVALAKGLNASQAKRLVGSTQEELEADADELLETFGGSTGKAGTTPPGRTPEPHLSPRGGTDPADEPVETNPAKLAESVPRQ